MVLYKSLLHRKHEIRRQIGDLGSFRVGFDPSIRVQFSEPCNRTMTSFLLIVVMGGLLSFLLLFRNFEILVDDSDEHLEHDD